MVSRTLAHLIAITLATIFLYYMIKDIKRNPHCYIK